MEHADLVLMIGELHIEKRLLEDTLEIQTEEHGKALANLVKENGEKVATLVAEIERLENVAKARGRKK